MRGLIFVIVATLMVGCSSKNKINAYTEPSSRHPSSAFSFSPQKSNLLIFNNTKNSTEDFPSPISQITLTPQGLQILGYYRGSSDSRSCIVSKSVAGAKGLSLGELALLIKGGVDVTCYLSGDGSGSSSSASQVSFSDRFQ